MIILVIGLIALIVFLLSSCFRSVTDKIILKCGGDEVPNPLYPISLTLKSPICTAQEYWQNVIAQPERYSGHIPRGVFPLPISPQSQKDVRQAQIPNDKIFRRYLFIDMLFLAQFWAGEKVIYYGDYSKHWQTLEKLFVGIQFIKLDAEKPDNLTGKHYLFIAHNEVATPNFSEKKSQESEDYLQLIKRMVKQIRPKAFSIRLALPKLWKHHLPYKYLSGRLFFAPWDYEPCLFGTNTYEKLIKTTYNVQEIAEQLLYLDLVMRRKKYSDQFDGNSSPKLDKPNTKNILPEPFSKGLTQKFYLNTSATSFDEVLEMKIARIYHKLKNTQN